MNRDSTFTCACGKIEEQSKRGRPRTKCMACRHQATLDYHKHYYQTVEIHKRRAAKEARVQA